MTDKKRIRCAIYTRKSSEEGLEQSFNSLHAQREACEAYIVSQRHEGWHLISTKYDDGGFSGGNMDRPALKRLLEDIAAKRVDTVVVYKVDRLTRSLADFAKIVEQFDKQGISFVSVTQQFNTTTSMGRLTLNVLLSFAQFEREVTGERIRDKIAASKQKGMWMGGFVPLGYNLKDRRLTINPTEADQVKEIFNAYLKLGCVTLLKKNLERIGIRSKKRTSSNGRESGGAIYSRGALYEILHNKIYLGEIAHKGKSYPGQHPAIIDRAIWDKVQKKFESNLQAPRKKKRATEQSLLTGLLFDQNGNRFTPSHTNKKGQRYRYYVSQAVIRDDKEKPTGPVRLPASEIEELVQMQFTLLLKSRQRMLEILTGPKPSPARVQSASKAYRHWITSPNHKLIELFKVAVKQVIVMEGKVEIQISPKDLRQGILDSQDSKSSVEGTNRLIRIKATAQLMRCGGEVRLVLPPDAPGAKTNAIPSLIRAIAKAHEWVECILRGEARNQSDLATKAGLNKRYVRQILPLAFLAPDITEAILDGKQAGHISLLGCIGNIPANWIEQRAQLTEP